MSNIPPLPGISPYLHGSHEPPPPDVMPDGWILFLEAVGHDGGSYPVHDYFEYAAAGYGVLCRIQHGWDGAGTFPLLDDLDGYVRRVASLVQNSQFCHRWIIGNEPNHRQEWPDGVPLQPEYSAHCYNRCWAAIHALPGHEFDEVIAPPIGPWNVDTGPGWIEYFERMLAACPSVDGIAIHAYTHGSDPRLITSEQRMNEPFDDRYFNFRVYRDWLNAVPDRLRSVPVYLTETNQNAAWLDERNGWMQEAHREIDAWNQSGAQVIRCVLPYRWPNTDPYGIEGKQNVIADWQAAQAMRYTWPGEDIPPEEDGPLQNPSFELPYVQHPQLSTVIVANGWSHFASAGAPPIPGGSSGPCQLPEFKPLTIADDPRRVYDGNAAQCWFIRWKVMDGGVFQRVEAEVGASYRFSVMAQAWCSDSDDPTVSDGELYVALGIDPTGGTDAFSLSVAWSDWEYIGANYEQVQSPRVLAASGNVTLFVRAANKWALSHNDVYIDAAELTKSGGGTQPPTNIDYERIRQIVREELDRTIWASGVG